MCCFLSVEFYAKWYAAFLGKSKFCAKIRKTGADHADRLPQSCMLFFYRFTLTKKLTSRTGSVQNTR